MRLFLCFVVTIIPKCGRVFCQGCGWQTLWEVWHRVRLFWWRNVPSLPAILPWGFLRLNWWYKQKCGGPHGWSKENCNREPNRHLSGIGFTFGWKWYEVCSRSVPKSFGYKEGWVWWITLLFSFDVHQCNRDHLPWWYVGCSRMTWHRYTPCP